MQRCAQALRVVGFIAVGIRPCLSTSSERETNDLIAWPTHGWQGLFDASIAASLHGPRPCSKSFSSCFWNFAHCPLTLQADSQ